MGNFLRTSIVVAAAGLGAAVARDADTYERGAVAKCAAHLSKDSADIPILPIDCMLYAFEMTDTYQDGVLVNRIHHLPAREEFLSAQEQELDPTRRYLALILAGEAVGSIVYILLPKAKH